MTIASAQVTVAATATIVVATVNAPTLVSVHVPTGGATVFVGPIGVATGTGLHIPAATTRDVQLWPGDALYGIVASSTQAVSVLRSSPG